MKIKTTSCNKGREKKTSLQGPGVLPGSTGYREEPKGGAERCGRKEERQVTGGLRATTKTRAFPAGEMVLN